MARIGIFPFLGRGHLNPIAALGRRLVHEGHDVTMFHLIVAKPAVRRAGLKCVVIDRDEASPEPDIVDSSALREKWRDTMDVVSRQARRVLREGPEAVKSCGIDYLLIDHMDLAASSVADYLGIPFITLSSAPPAILNDEVPPSYFGWEAAGSAAGRRRIRLANDVVRRITSPVLVVINDWRGQKGLLPLRDLNDVFSKHAVITQVPKCFDLPRKNMPATLFHAGQFRDQWNDASVTFPWERLTGKPLIFASLGTVRNNDLETFRTIADATTALDAQLIISLGAGKLAPSDLKDVARDTVIVDFAPQREIFEKAVLTINCAGLNTTLDCIAAGVPMVAIPIAEDQPGVAARIRRAGIGVVVPVEDLSVGNLRSALTTVLSDSSYRKKTEFLRAECSAIDGTGMATRIIRDVLRI